MLGEIDRLRASQDRLHWEHQNGLLEADIARLRALLARCQVVLSNMAMENEGAIFNRWPISHEPLRADAKSILPDVDAALER